MNKTNLGEVGYRISALRCPNKECGQLVLQGELTKAMLTQGDWKSLGLIQRWNLLPESTARVLPDYVPASIVEDYKEACRVRDLSPKASATLARRALQGMIRDFWNISRGSLKEEIDALETIIDPGTWGSIDAVRSVGNIGAHMEKDVNIIVPIDPEETQLLIELIESLVDDWYIARHKKQERNKAMASLAAEKAAARKAPPKQSSTGTV